MRDYQAKEQSSLASRIKTLMIMKPKPSPFPLIRIGGEEDGAYLIPDDLGGITACFSPGVNNAKEFEDDLTDNYGITCHLCDFSSDEELFRTPLRQGLQTFRKKWLDPNGGDDSISLDDWVNEECQDSHEELLLQMDIEGAEYKNLLACSEATLMRFRIIVVELHGLDVSNDPTRFETELGPLLRRLDHNHLCVHAHPNNCCGEFRLEESYLMVPRVIELTFLRRDRLYHADNHQLRHPLLPHPLDIDFNVRDNPPLLLEGDWLDLGSRSQDSFEALSTWKKVNLLANKLKHIDFMLKRLEDEHLLVSAQLSSAQHRIEYLERRFAELERPIQLYLKVKRMLKKDRD